jgi:hypothetical protein
MRSILPNPKSAASLGRSRYVTTHSVSWSTHPEQLEDKEGKAIPHAETQSRREKETKSFSPFQRFLTAFTGLFPSIAFSLRLCVSA